MGVAEPHARERVVDELLHELVGHVDDPPAGAAPDLRHLEVVLQAHVSGVRYVLLREAARSEAPVVRLSGRELEIARMIAGGHTNRTIAAVLDISQWTVSTHLRRIFAKLGVGSRAAMVARLVAQGQLDEPPGRVV